jgi:membrane-associated phospholipid phosphatase
LAVLAAAYLVLTAAWFALGELILSLDAVVRTDGAVDRWFVGQRTSRLNSLTAIGSSLSSTEVKVVITALAAGICVLLWRRWLEPLMLIVPLVLEASVFITTTWLVGRPRPDVARLESSPVDSSFPSGHVAAAVVYAAIAIVVFWHTSRRWLRAVAVGAVSLVVVIVAYSRMYRGMHHLTDVIAGGLLGAVSVWVSWLVLRPRGEAESSRDR